MSSIYSSQTRIIQIPKSKPIWPQYQNLNHISKLKRVETKTNWWSDSGRDFGRRPEGGGSPQSKRTFSLFVLMAQWSKGGADQTLKDSQMEWSIRRNNGERLGLEGWEKKERERKRAVCIWMREIDRVLFLHDKLSLSQQKVKKNSKASVL